MMSGTYSSEQEAGTTINSVIEDCISSFQTIFRNCMRYFVVVAQDISLNVEISHNRYPNLHLICYVRVV
ncbi:hypothetical protein T08_4936 [Trichinella sp. T8]|nr:hypothetical protein T08_4936 [Trichinella sp. T8]